MKYLLLTALLLLGCNESRKVVLAQRDAIILTDQLDAELYFSLYQKEVTRGILESYITGIYINNCELR